MIDGLDWTLELHLRGAPAVLTMVFRTQAAARAAQRAVALVIDGTGKVPKTGWIDDDGAEICLQHRDIIGMRLARRGER
jgi:hypothetical protein